MTSAELSVLQSSNLPEKSNFHGRNGLEALTGKSNFDISEWMLLQNFAWFQGKRGTMAMLCKTSVARKVLVYAWQKKIKVSSAYIFKIDAGKYFGASVDACLLVMQLGEDALSWDCKVFNSLTDKAPTMNWGYKDDIILSDITSYQALNCGR